MELREVQDMPITHSRTARHPSLFGWHRIAEPVLQEALMLVEKRQAELGEWKLRRKGWYEGLLDRSGGRNRTYVSHYESITVKMY